MPGRISAAAASGLVALLAGCGSMPLADCAASYQAAFYVSKPIQPHPAFDAAKTPAPVRNEAAFSRYIALRYAGWSDKQVVNSIHVKMGRDETDVLVAGSQTLYSGQLTILKLPDLRQSDGADLLCAMPVEVTVERRDCPWRGRGDMSRAMPGVLVEDWTTSCAAR